MRRVLLTGGSGFVGANLARRLLEDGDEVHLLLRQGHARWRIETILDEVYVHVVDLDDVAALESRVASIRPDWVFHLAAYGAYSSQTNFRQMAETNLVATANLVEACVKSGFEAFINTGSSSEYGFKDHAPSEDELIEPNSFYAVTKAAATHYCRYIAQSKNVNLATVRLYSVFGPYEAPTRLIPSLIVDGLQGRLPPLVNPSIARDYVFVDDVCEAYLSLASNLGGVSAKVYNLGSGTTLSLREVVEVACTELAITVKPLWGSMPDREWDTSIWVSDSSRISRDLGWKPGYSFADGFRRTVNWFRSHPDLLTFYQNHREAPR